MTVPEWGTMRLSPGDLTLGEKLNALPARPGVYQFRNAEGRVLYVGKAAVLRNRVRQYFHRSRPSDPRIDAMVAKIADVEIIVTDSAAEALMLESNLIKRLEPRYNVVLKDDKSYPFIVITDEPYPRVVVTRRRTPGQGRYFGPYTDVKTMRFALKTVRDIFMIRSCNYDLTEEAIARRRFKVCLDYHIRKCEGPCEALVSRATYQAMIQKVAQVLRGKTLEVVRALERDMDESARALRFEEAAHLRDQIRALSVYEQKQKVFGTVDINRDVIAVARRENDACAVHFSIREGKLIGSRHLYLAQIEQVDESEMIESVIERTYLEDDDVPPEIALSVPLPESSVIPAWLNQRAGHTVTIILPGEGEAHRLVSMARTNAEFWLDELAIQRTKRGERIPVSLQHLQRDLGLGSLPRRIECFDISNTQGSDSVGSLVVFVDAKPRRSEYRTFKIRTVEGPDDFASIQEVVQRRYQRVLQEQGVLPDLIMVDGGKGQLSSACEVLSSLGLQRIPIVGLAKRLEEVFRPHESDPLLLPKASLSLRVLQQVRDEAHRFAVTFHRKVRSKRVLRTELDLIGGVGKKRATELLEAFGSVQGVKFATTEQLVEIVGEKLTERIRSYFASDESMADTPTVSTDETQSPDRSIEHRRKNI